VKTKTISSSSVVGYSFGALLLGCIVYLMGSVAAARPSEWQREWPRTDFSLHSVDYSEIQSGGPSKDGIPPIDRPQFELQSEVDGIGPLEPVVSVVIKGDARAYPLRVLIWHEIVNDTVGGVPIAVTFCPLCNTSIIFDRRLAGQVLDFGTTGKLRRSDLIMYDRQTESWWQQFLGEGIVGKMTGKRLKMIPARLESISRFRERYPEGMVLVPKYANTRAYGKNPYEGYDTSARPFLYDGDMPKGIAPLARVVRVGNQAWSLAMLKQKRSITTDGGLKISWYPGQNSALDTVDIQQGTDIGNIVVVQKTGSQQEEVPYSVDFAFAFHAFRPEGVIYIR